MTIAAGAQLQGDLVIEDQTATLKIGDWNLTLTDKTRDALRRAMLQQVMAHAAACGVAVLLQIVDHPDRTALLVQPDGAVKVHEAPSTTVHVLPPPPTATDSDHAERSATETETYSPRFASGRPTDVATLTTQALTEPLVILVANTKGGAGKTPLAVVMAEALASTRGGDVALIDLDPTGDLCHRAGSHESSLSSLVAVAQAAHSWSDLTGTMAWQEDSRLWVVGAADEHVSGPGLAAVISALSAGVRIFVLDAGNSDREEVYRAATQMADQLVVPVNWDEATVRFGAAPTTSRLFARGLRQLALRAIVVGTHAPFRWPNRAQKAQYMAEFTRLGHAVIELPSDRHLDAGGAIRWNALRPRTRTAAQMLTNKIMDRAQLGQHNEGVQGA